MMYLIVFGQGLHMGHSELCAGVLCRAYTERRRSPVAYIVLCHGQGSLQIYCAGRPACGSFPSRSRPLGPLVVGLILDVTGNIRYAFFFLVFMVWLAVTILLSGNVEQGGTDAKNYYAEGVWMRASCESCRFRRGIVDTPAFILDLVIYIFYHHR